MFRTDRARQPLERHACEVVSLASRRQPEAPEDAAAGGAGHHREAATAFDVLARIGDRRQMDGRSSLVLSSDRGAHLYLVESGLIEVILKRDAAGIPIASFESGAIFLCDADALDSLRYVAPRPSVIIDVPLSRLDRLAEEGLDLRLLLYWCPAFDLQAFVAACYGE